MNTKPQRIYSIDMLKGICMIGMLMDHWRIHLSYVGHAFLGSANPVPLYAESLNHVTTASFWMLCLGSHFIAPAFLFLAGAGAYLWQERRGHKASLFSYLVSRGAMLALLNCLLFFHKPFSEGGTISLHVLWPAGIGMILLGCIATLPRKILWAIALACIIGQNIFQEISFTYAPLNTLWSLGFMESFIPLPWGAKLYNLWPVMPWFGILLLGYLCGSLFLQGQKSFATWLKLGISCLIFFLLLRLTGVYGDANIWHIQDSLLKTLGNIITVTKYPPSLQYTLYGLGITFLLLSLLERYQLSNTMLIALGSTPLFFYVIHTVCLRALRYTLFYLPESFMESHILTLLSFTGIAGTLTLMTLIFWFLCVQYKNIIKKIRLKKS